MTLVLAEEPPMLASHDATATFSYPVMRNVTEALLNRNPKTNEVVGELATKWEQTNPTTWRFTLREGVKFHDGTPWNAEAAADAMNEMWARENRYRVRNFIGPEFETKAVSEYVIEVVTADAGPDPADPVLLRAVPLADRAQGAPRRVSAQADRDRALQVRRVGQGPAHQADQQPGLVGPHRRGQRWRRDDQGRDLGRAARA